MELELLQSISLAVSQARTVGCLHLAASAGRSRVNGTEWTGIEGAFRRIPLGVRKVGQVGSTGKSFLIEDAALHPELTAHPEWIREEGIHGFAGHPRG